MARLRHPDLDAVIKVPDSAVGHLAQSGWVPAEGEPPPTCPRCGQVWPAYVTRQLTEQQEGSPAESGDSSSQQTQQPRRRRASASKESEG
jgi:hypothetical protein